jgi:dipeptidyl aminopeptidase/acylaminoacyl peptidase
MYQAQILCVALITAMPLFGQIPGIWTPEFSMEIQTVGTVVPSPDGTRALWTQTKARMDGQYSENVTQIWLARGDGSDRVQLTHSEKSSTNPKWSADDKWVYFTSLRFGKDDLFRIPVSGGEAEQMTRLKGGVGVFAVSKDGKWAAYTSAEPDPDDEKAIKEKRDKRVLDMKPKNAVIYVIPAQADDKGERKPRAVTSPDRHVQQIAWSPDGTNIAFTYWKTPVVNEWRKARVAETTVATGAIKEIGYGGGFAGTPAYSPDGRYIAFPQPSVTVFNPGAERVAVYDRETGSTRPLNATPDEQPRIAGWMPGNRTIVVSEAKKTGSALYEVPVDGPVKEIFAPAEGILGPVSMNEAGTVLGMSHESSDLAPEAYVLPPGGNRLVQVSAANTALDKPQLGKTSVFAWKSKDGKSIEGLLTYPVGYQAGKKVPLILNIHGGPAGGFNQNYIGRAALYPLATFSAKGYAILRPNPHGSTGYGKEFRYANSADWGGKDYEDDQAGVDALIAEGIADPDRLVVMGWSYGGYITGWTIGHTNRFKAAALGAPVIDLLSFTGTTDIADFLPDYFGGEAWQQPELYRTRSPIAYVDKVSTPSLILQGDADERVPLGQGLEFYHALKRRGIPAKMVVYPRQPHNPYEPKFVLDIMKRNLDWVEQYVR